jgi:hypothetical protein
MTRPTIFPDGEIKMVVGKPKRLFWVATSAAPSDTTG